MPAMPEDAEAGVIEGLYRWATAPDGPKHRATILFSGSANLAAREAQTQLAEHYDVAAELCSATTYKRLREQALSTERWNRLHPASRARTPRVTGAPRRRRARDRGHRLHEGGPRPDRPLGAPGPLVHAARHRRLRPQRHPRGAAALLRDRRPARRRGHAGRAGGGRRGRSRRSSRTPSTATTSTPSGSIRASPSEVGLPGSYRWPRNPDSCTAWSAANISAARVWRAGQEVGRTG